MRHFFYDSLKRFLMVFVATLAIVAPSFADEAIQSVTVVGATQQSGSPTPSAPDSIKTNNGVLKVSRNLFDKDGVTIETGKAIGADGSLSNISVVNLCASYIPVSPNTTYTFSGDVLGTSNVFFRVAQYKADQTFVSRSEDSTGSRSSYTFTTGADTHYIRFHYVVSADISTYQLEQGPTATPYHPYGEIYTDGTVETIADSANHTATVATLLGVGDYRDTQNINTGTITRRVGVKVLDGTEDWVNSSIVYYGIAKTKLNTNIAANSTAVICTHYAASATSGVQNTIWVGNKNVNWLVNETFSTIQEWKNFLAAQYAAGTPVIVIYPLATETTESVAGQTMTTAPVRQISGSLSTTIRTILTNGQELVTSSISSGIQIATTKYTEDAFAGLVATLNSAIDKVTNIVDDTVQQATEIGELAQTKQDRPDTDCPAGRKCLLIMGADNKPHWYLIQE